MMDTSETFIKQCEKAEEIQVLRPMNQRWEMGDYVSEGYIRWTIAEGKMGRCFSDIWLPRQDQLQEMVAFERDDMGYTDITFWLLHKFWDFVEEHKPIHHKGETRSMEQLWLAFVYKEKYNKAWNGEQWTS
jgi:hypothetical protein